MLFVPHNVVIPRPRTPGSSGHCGRLKLASHPADTKPSAVLPGSECSDLPSAQVCCHQHVCLMSGKSTASSPPHLWQSPHAAILQVAPGEVPVGSPEPRCGSRALTPRELPHSTACCWKDHLSHNSSAIIPQKTLLNRCYGWRHWNCSWGHLRQLFPRIPELLAETPLTELR